MKLISKVFFCLSILAINALYAQDVCKISGIVKDLEKNSPIEADVRLFTQDTAFVKGTKCDSLGNFLFENLSSGKYKLEINLAEYSTLSVKDVIVNESAPSKSFDTLKLKKQNVTTDEILVEEEKGIMSFVGDKKVFNVDKSTVTKGGNALDVLKKVPMVDVDINDNVSLRGSQNVKILIDDKPSKFVSLKQIPSDAIDRVEVITNPSAKYESEGVTGLINIVMKKNTTNYGFTGNLNLGSGYKDRYWGGGDLNFKKSKLLLSGSLYLGKVAGYTFNNDANVNYTSPVSFYRTNASGSAKNDYIFAQGGIEYEVSQGSSLGFDFNFNSGKWTNKIEGISRSYDSSDKLYFWSDGLNIMNGTWKGLTGSLYYNNKMNDKGRELSGDLTLTTNKNKYDMNIARQDYDGNNTPLSANIYKQRDNTDNNSYNLNAQIDFVNPFSNETRLEAGYKGTFRQNDNDFVSDSLDYTLNQYVKNPAVSFRFKLTENINAGYFVFSSSLLDFNYKLGLRLEHTNSKGELFTVGKDFTKNYIDVFPTVSISRKIGNIHQLSLSYSRRITRPNIWRLNPFINKNDPKFYFMGNPDLDPEFTDAYELSYSLFLPVLSVTPMVFYRQSHDVISNYTYRQDTSVLVTTYRNASGSKSYGMDIVLSSRAFPWLNMTGTLSMYNTKFDKDPISDYAQEKGFLWKANLRVYLLLGSLFNFEVYYNYEGKKVLAQGKNLPTNNLDLGISKNFFNNKLTLSFRASDVFKSMQWGQDVNTSTYNGTYRNKFDSRSFYLNLSFRFGNTDEYYQKKKKVKQNTNEQNDQQENNTGIGR